MGNFISKIKQLSQSYKNYRYKKIIDKAIADMYIKNNTELPEPNDTMICPCIECKCNLEKSNLEKCNLVVCNCTCNLSEDLVEHILDAIKLSIMKLIPPTIIQGNQIGRSIIEI